MADQKITFSNQKGEEYNVSPGGSLGLLALGSVGVRAWKKAKKEWEDNQKSEIKKNKVLLVGWDSADWKIIDKLMANGFNITM